MRFFHPSLALIPAVVLMSACPPGRALVGDKPAAEGRGLGKEQAIALASQRTSGANDPASPSGSDGRIVRWIGAGGGFDPRSTQVSLEQDLVLARNTLGPDGLIFFAGGANAFGVQVLNRKERPETLFRELGDLLDSREGRDAFYRRTRLKPDGPATADNVLAALRSALAHGDSPLLLFVAAHGELGESPRDNSALLWSATELKVSDLAETLDKGVKQRQLRLVVTSCYSGGFADIVFADADPEKGAAETDRCGFFASEWDQVSSGCDPDPDRRSQEGYGMHFLQALRGRSRSGQVVAEEDVDFDHDGRISLLEAHSRARITSDSIDVPTTTSERWLREMAPKEGPETKVALPEEDIVIAVLKKRLLVEDEAAARAQQREISARMEKLKAKLDDGEMEEATQYERLRVALLERWPALDDPWHPLFPRYIRRDRESIESFLRNAPEVARYRKARRLMDNRGIRYDQARFHAAMLQRLLRAYENRTLAARLHSAGGTAWKQYERLLACERSVP